MASGSRSSKGGSASNAGCVFWLAAFIIVVFVFLLNLGKIKETLDKTNFTEIVKTQRELDRTPPPVKSAPKVEADPTASVPTKVEASDPARDSGATAPSAAPDAAPPAAPRAGSDQGGTAAAQPGAASVAAPDQAGAAGSASSSSAAPAAAGGGSAAAAKPAPAKKPAANATTAAPAGAAPAKSRQASLYFIRIDEDGTIVRQEVKRAVPLSDSPLTDALAALFKGPSEEEIRRKLISLIPQGTKLLSVQVRGSTAVLNLSEEFMYNHYGIEGYAGQLKQVVYTATAFSTVQDVQIVIEGEKHDYLGGEGVYIGRPLSRNSF